MQRSMEERRRRNLKTQTDLPKRREEEDSNKNKIL